MSEYWKSTPKYWCKHCQTFVTDTKLARTQHEATGKHQGALKRFLRDLHKKGEREAAAKEAAKREVDRLNGVPSSSAVRGVAPVPKPVGTQASTAGPARQATEADRKAQAKQLEDLGVSLPGAVRADMALPGEWETVSEDVAKDSAVAAGKRKYDEDQLLEEEERRYRRKPGGRYEEIDIEEREMKSWKAMEMAYPAEEDEEEELPPPPPPVNISFKLKKEEGVIKQEDGASVKAEPGVKAEATDGNVLASIPTAADTISFKARKGKNIRKK